LQFDIKQANLTEHAQPEKLEWTHVPPGVVLLEPSHLAMIVYNGATWTFECRSEAKEKTVLPYHSQVDFCRRPWVSMTEIENPTRTATEASNSTPSGFLAEVENPSSTATEASNPTPSGFVTEGQNPSPTATEASNPTPSGFLAEGENPNPTATEASNPTPSGFLADGIPIPFGSRDGSEYIEIEYLKYLISGLALNNSIIICPTNTGFIKFALNFNCRVRSLGIANVLY